MLSRTAPDSVNGAHSTTGRMRRTAAMVLTVILAVLGLASIPSAAQAAPNAGIVVDDVVIGDGTGEGGQLVVGDVVSVSGTWDASDADPHEGDTFVIGVPAELKIPADVPFNLTGPRQDGSIAVWATCLATSSTGELVCTLTEEVEANPELVRGEFAFDIEAVEATTEKELEFDLNGEGVAVALPGDGGIHDGYEVPDGWSKSGEMNDNNWSMTWTIDLPGARMQGHDAIVIDDELGAGHVLCEPSELKVVTVRGNTVVDVTGISSLAPGDDDQHFSIRLDAPETGGFDPNVTYRITYATCTPDGQIDPEDTVYTNEASIDVWGETSGVIGVSPDPWHIDLVKTGSVLGGGDRNGKIAWSVIVPGDHLIGKDGFDFSETLGDGHELCTDTISGLRVTEYYGPSNQRQRDVTGLLDQTVVSESSHAFELAFAIDDEEFEFRPSDYRYVVTYKTCVTQDALPEGGTAYSNEVDVDGLVAGTDAKVPGRTDQKTGAINGSAVTIDGVSRLPQTTINWNITVPGERLQDVASDLVVTDTLTGAHGVCTAGSPGGGLKTQLGLKVQARDQISGGGLSTVDLTDSVTATQDGDDVVYTIPQPTLPQPGGGEATGFSTEYQYVITYTTCTTSGGMDAPGTTYGNTAVVNGKTYDRTVTQNNRGSGSGSGVPRGSVSIDKLLVDNAGAALVPDDAKFTVHVKEIDPSGTAQIEYDLQVPLNGDPVSGPNSRGTGWTAELSEPTFPKIPGVVFGDPVFAEADGVTPGADGTTAVAALDPGKNISVSLTNEAQLGSLSIVKQLEGGAYDEVELDRTYAVTAHIDTSALGENVPAQPDREFELTVGEPETLDDLPIGAVVTFTEARPADDDLFTWGEPQFSPEQVTITADHVGSPAEVVLTNSVERTVGTFSLVKLVTGDQADNSAVPDSVTVTASWEQRGEANEKTLTLPTDGTPVPFDEQLLIGTEVTLTETEPADGSSIAWSAPAWSGEGVSIDGPSAVVTVTRDAEATVTVENRANTSIAGISLIKAIAGEAAGEVGSDAEFPVTASWTDADGEPQSRELTIGTTEPTPLGVDLPAGTVVTIAEGDRPAIDTVVWDAIVISGDDVTDAGDGTAEIVVSDQHEDVTLVTVINEATWAPGTFSLSKQIAGIDPERADVPESVEVTASWIADGEQATETLQVPTDGSEVPFGTDLPHGTEVTLSETKPDDAAAFTWAAPEWDAEGIVVNDDGTAVITIGAAQRTEVALTNTAVASLGTLSITKTLAGEGADRVPTDTAFPVTATWTDLLGEQQSAELHVTADEPAVLGDLPLGTEVTLAEGEGDLPEGAAWQGAAWSSDDESVEASGDGAEVVVTVTGDAGTAASIGLQNEFDAVDPPSDDDSSNQDDDGGASDDDADGGTSADGDHDSGLAVTGGQVLPGGIAVAVLLILGGGALLVARRVRRS